MPALGIGLGLQFTRSRAAYVKEASDYFKRMTTAPSADFKKLVNAYIVEQKASGLWDKKAVIVMLQAESAQAATLNMKGDFNNATFVNSPTFTANDGVTADVGYINSNFNPTTHGSTIFTQNNAGVLIYIKTDIAATVYDIANSALSAPYIGVISRQATNNRSSLLINDGTTVATAVNSVMSSIGIFGLYRTANNLYNAYRNGLDYSGNRTTASTGLPNDDLFIGRGVTTTLTGRKYGYYEITSGLNPAQALENANQLKTLLNYTP